MLEIEKGADIQIDFRTRADRLIECNPLVAFDPEGRQAIAFEQKFSIRQVGVLEQRIDGALQRHGLRHDTLAYALVAVGFSLGLACGAVAAGVVVVIMIGLH